MIGANGEAWHNPGGAKVWQSGYVPELMGQTPFQGSLDLEGVVALSDATLLGVSRMRRTVELSRFIGIKALCCS